MQSPLTTPEWIFAEARLYELAQQLRRVPFDASSQRIHVRALELKRAVSSWRERVPSHEERETITAEIERCRREAARAASIAS